MKRISIAILSSVVAFGFLRGQPDTSPETILFNEWTPESLGQVIDDLWELEPDDLREVPQVILEGIDSTVADVYVYNRGKLITYSHTRANGGPSALGRALYESRLWAGDQASEATELVIFLGRAIDEGPIDQFWESPWTYNAHAGMVGFTSVGPERELLRYISPLEILAVNQSGDTERLKPLLNLEGAQTVEVVTGQQLWVRLGADAKAYPLIRGSLGIQTAEITRQKLEEAATLAEGWLLENIQDTGRLVYRFHPSTCQEERTNNMIRQWMATLVLAEIAQERPEDTHLAEKVSQNIGYNLKHYYREDQLFGLIEYSEKVKLGAAALAALTLSKAPQPQQWSRQLEALDRTVSHLWNNDGSFRTFYRPRERNDNQNFYPGEALLYWTYKYANDPNPFLLNRIWKSIEYYQAWHAENLNPAFVPWHTMAYAQLWEVEPDERLIHYIFAMNDWLLQMQQQADEVIYPDMAGRFYAPGKGWGIPHVSSTAVYLEGLAAALGIAKQRKDAERVERYSQALREGLRNLLQLQYNHPAELYYMAEGCRRSVLGGFRTAVYDSEIRCDNVQHALQAIRAALKHLDGL